MRVLFIGGTGFSGPKAVRRLLERGCETMVFHRGRHANPGTAGAVEVLGDRNELLDKLGRFREFGPDVIVDMVAFTREHAASLVRLARKLSARIVVVSSVDVYLAYGRLCGSEPGPPEPTPLREDARLRGSNQPHGAEYDKLAVEREARAAPELAAAILRMPAIYGPGDLHRRLFAYVKRMRDRRDAILLDRRHADWAMSRCYVDHAAQAIALAASRPEAAGHTYNVADAVAWREAEWLDGVGRALSWNGEIVRLAPNRMPAYLRQPFDLGQAWTVDSGKIRQELGFEDTVGPEEAIFRAAEWEAGRTTPAEHAELLDYAAEDAALREAAGDS